MSQNCFSMFRALIYSIKCNLNAPHLGGREIVFIKIDCIIIIRTRQQFRRKLQHTDGLYRNIADNWTEALHMGYLFSNEERKEEMEGRSVENDRLKKELNTT